MRGKRKDTSGVCRGRRVLVRTFASLGLAILAGSAAAVPVAVPVPATAQRVHDGIAAYERKDCAEADRQLRPLMQGDPNAATLSGTQTLAFDLLISCAARADRKEAAYADALAGTHIGEGDDYLWRMRFFLEIETDRAEAAVATAEAMPAAQPSLLSDIDGSWFYRLDRLLKDKGQSALRERLLKLLSSDAYKPEDGPIAKDGFRVLHARLLAGRPGGEAEARAEVAAVRSPYWLRRASVDLALRPFLPADIDLRAAVEATLKADRDAATAHPDRLRPLDFAADDLLELGRPDEALRLLQSVATEVEDPKAFTDRDKNIPWWWDDVGRSDQALGRYDEAVAALRHGMALSERGAPNVSQAINLAILQNRFGHPRDALATLAIFDDPAHKTSPFGQIVLRFARGCAHVLLGEKGKAAPDLAYARAHEEDSPSDLTDLLLCAGDLDGAASVLIRRLDDPEQRADALLALSDYPDPPVRLPPPPTERGLAAVKARPDVQAAIARAGGTRHFNVLPSEV
ncbi:MAG TPA: tetratricopeptide repeat protein [Allosphingosinicella sp.]|jgi:tetratricopeptide (TPR) repeat protein